MRMAVGWRFLRRLTSRLQELERSKARPKETNRTRMISTGKHLKTKCGTQMCGGCQALEKKSDVEHNSNTPPITYVTYVIKPGKAPLFFSDV